MKALIAAGGHATRLRPITYTLNKHLIPLANRPMIEYAIEKIVDCGIREIAINVNPGEVEIQRVVGNGDRWGVEITYLEQQGGPKGIAHTVANAASWINGESFVFYLGDNIILAPIKSLVERFERDHLDCLLALSHVDDPQRFGVPEIKDGRIVRVLEKPEHPPSDFAVTGIYFYGPKMLEAVTKIQPSARGEYEISDAHTWMIEQGCAVGYEEITGWWKDTGKPNDLIIGNNFILDLIVEPSIAPSAQIAQDVRIEGVVTVGERVTIDEGSVLQGPVCIADGCHISGSEIGPHVSIGANAVIRRATVSETILMDDVVIEGGPKIVKSIFGRSARAVASEQQGSCTFIIGDRAQIEW